jgi:DNA-binding NtrC family response regulator
MNGSELAPVTLIAIDDDPRALRIIAEGLEQEGLEILTASDPEEGLQLVYRHRPRIVLLDLVMPRIGGMELLERIVEWAPETEVILITANYSTESAVEAIRKGAADYLTKPISLDQLNQRVSNLMEETRRRQRALSLDAELARTNSFEGMVGRSPLMFEVFSRIRRVAPHFKAALVTGETGTGKELVAAALHHLSPVSSNRLVVCNASAVVETLFESELFGHVKGAFTGATYDKIGLIEHAHQGTLFLDEIGDMPLSTQAKLLRALQSQEVQRVGSLTPRRVDVRLIAATNRDLKALIAERRFREDLYYRLSRVEIRLPRLAERKQDLPLLARHFIDLFAVQYGKTIRGLSPRAELVLARYAWPGNIRELENVLGEACMLAEGECIDVRDLPDHIRRPAPSETAADIDDDLDRAASELLPLAQVHRKYVLRVLARVGGNKLRAAKILGINRATLYRMLEEEEPAPALSGEPAG